MGKPKMPVEAPIQRASMTLVFLKLAWRFYSGHHMDGQRRRLATGKVMPQHTDYFWNRYSRPKRAFWRNLVFIFLSFLTYGLLYHETITIFCLLTFVPFVISRIFGKLGKTFTQVVYHSDADGFQTHYRVLRPKYRALLLRLKPTRIRFSPPDGGPVPPEYQKTILAENAVEHGDPISSLRIPRPDSKETGRERTTRRRLERIKR